MEARDDIKVRLTIFLNMSLKLVHQNGSIAFQLFCSADCAKGDFSKSLFRVWTITYTTNSSTVTNHGYGYMSMIEH